MDLDNFRSNLERPQSMPQSSRPSNPPVKTEPVVPLNLSGIKKADKPIAKSQSSDEKDLFGGKTEISREEMRKALKSNEGYDAQRSVGLSLSEEGRAKLEKSVFPNIYGRNISKTDFKSAVRKLELKVKSSADSKSKEELRKEIKFFKKIGKV